MGSDRMEPQILVEGTELVMTRMFSDKVGQYTEEEQKEALKLNTDEYALTSPGLYQYLRNWFCEGIPKPEDRSQVLQLRLLYGFFGFWALFAFYDPEFVMYAVNPWGLPWWAHFPLFELKQFLLVKNDRATRAAMVKLNLPKLPFRYSEAGAEFTGKNLEKFDFFYLRVNAVLDMCFLYHLTNFLFRYEGVARSFSEFTFLNTFVAYWVLLVVADSCYSFAHNLMHANRTLYNAMHLHHHRFVIPEKNFVDVRNYHPVEMLIGMSVLWPAFYAAMYTTGVSHVAMICYFFTSVTFNCINHSEFDIRCNFFGWKYDSGDHEMHHRYPNCNMALYCMWLDRLVGTYRPYVGREEAEELIKAEALRRERSAQLLVSPKASLMSAVSTTRDAGAPCALQIQSPTSGGFRARVSAQLLSPKGSVLSRSSSFNDAVSERDSAFDGVFSPLPWVLTSDPQVECLQSNVTRTPPAC